MSRLVALLGVSESGYYAYRKRPPSPRALRHAWLTQLILTIHHESGASYGYRRIHQELHDRYGVTVSHGTVEHLMRQARIHGRTGRTAAPNP
ncbi:MULTISPECIES: IS3 family transposase [unclassified Streptomyces]|uniref:IS3 family transposase n=1 Tax=unclassified Streptomyces TaxID=2593676 RepID=UPI0033F90AFE